MFDQQVQVQKDMVMAEKGYAINQGLIFEYFKFCLQKVCGSFNAAMKEVTGEGMY